MSGVPQSILVKIERANHHIKDLDLAISNFLNSGPYKTIGEIDSDGRAVYRVSRVEPIPIAINVITGDAIHNLRASLDYLICALWRRTNSGECERIQFPCPGAADYKANGLGKIQGMGQDAIGAISAVEPYQGGNGDILWRLHRLSIIDKHRLPITVVGGNLGIHLPTFYPEMFTDSAKNNPWIMNVTNMRFGLKENDELFRDELSHTKTLGISVLAKSNKNASEMCFAVIPAIG